MSRAVAAVGGGLREYLPAAILLALLIAGWEAYVRAEDVRPYMVPAPSRIWDAFVATRDGLPEHTWTTAREALLGLALGAAAGIAIAVPVASVPLVRRVVYPLLVTSQTVPIFVLAPVLVVWFGYGMTPKVVVVALFAVFPVAVSTVDGLVRADRELVDLVRSMGGSRVQVLRLVRVPAAIPGFFSGFKIAAAYAVVGAVIGEWVGASSGLGLYITRSQGAFRTDQVFVGIVLVALLSLALFALAHIAARLATPWLYATTSEEDAR